MDISPYKSSKKRAEIEMITKKGSSSAMNGTGDDAGTVTQSPMQMHYNYRNDVANSTTKRVGEVQDPLFSIDSAVRGWINENPQDFPFLGKDFSPKEPRTVGGHQKAETSRLSKDGTTEARVSNGERKDLDNIVFTEMGSVNKVEISSPLKLNDNIERVDMFAKTCKEGNIQKGSISNTKLLVKRVLFVVSDMEEDPEGANKRSKRQIDFSDSNSSDLANPTTNVKSPRQGPHAPTPSPTRGNSLQ
ncbi:PREDICTED: uncharacterized protein LOC104611933 [Nelumbo nucifera]|uniref:Uncharacterized protein LOC104611933 n=1 Tax=Nelumbo nucifera TaxID=4432 RepID=A0A1U8BK32_NELNU|nr:PREDICTED: uncharacterized protein LOC104611933 [Nelumbo nucifera]